MVLTPNIYFYFVCHVGIVSDENSAILYRLFLIVTEQLKYHFCLRSKTLQFIVATGVVQILVNVGLNVDTFKFGQFVLHQRSDILVKSIITVGRA